MAPLPAQAITPAAPNPTACGCGKRAWPSKADADRIVVNAKIRRGLQSNAKRREQASYQCPRNLQLWHVTSQGDVPMPDYPTDDDQTAQDFIGKQLNRPNDDTWTALLAPERAEQTLRVLGRIHQSVQAKGADKRAGLAALKGRSLAREIPRSEYDAAEQEHKDWLRRSGHFQAATIARLQEARQVVKTVNIARSASEEHVQSEAHREALRRLSLAVQRHRSQTSSPTATDRQLWAWLGVLTVPYMDGVTTIAEMLDSGSWVEHREEAS
jgi:hypothetical protein